MGKKSTETRFCEGRKEKVTSTHWVVGFMPSSALPPFTQVISLPQMGRLRLSKAR